MPIKQVIGIGGVAKKSAFVMQTLADVLNRPIKIAKSEQAPALGAAMYAAVAAGLYPDVLAAQAGLGSGFAETYTPDSTRRRRLRPALPAVPGAGAVRGRHAEFRHETLDMRHENSSHVSCLTSHV